MERIAPCTMDACAMAADRAARNAVAGPRTTEYGPCTEGKREIVRTARITTTVSSHRVRLQIIGESTARLLALPIAITPPAALDRRWSWRNRTRVGKEAEPTETGNRRSVRCGFGFWQRSNPARSDEGFRAQATVRTGTQSASFEFQERLSEGLPLPATTTPNGVG